ncbi:pyridoxamine 5'-phosphate oxidase family protein [Marinactinospora thermotolerans]|uniref:Nitroimidazol reductase NimA, pyridoxamine 5'-phosphate oxidase superfamily n=1 Tax=Marinactinospora thermotolerans DSM 45154 TaxID=1122192 RepID=A0A1T4K8W7_9ACTN|nr:pyridoxamine 5'-phosphate oxidase family protein [Marinactinospora thermotolerans]SJZ38874.1 hypothetical protein SAMN02745673_00242 [Marinactinospora thermotolerans DSM 45154]
MFASSSTPDAPRTIPTRRPDRARHDRATVHAILDSDFVCHLGFVADGRPVVLPTLYARVGERLYLHGSTGSRPLRAAGRGLEVCVTVTTVQGIVLARSAMHHSLNYRSVVAHGTAHRVTDPEELQIAFDALLDQTVPGRSAGCRPPNAKERAATAVLRLDLDTVSAKIREGGVNDDPADADLPHWAGVVPVWRAIGSAVPDPALPHGTPLPDHLRRFVEDGGQRPR